MSESLKQKTVKGVAWSGIDNVTQYAVQFVVGIILARLLSPDDYGLLGIVAIFTAVCGTLIDSGFSMALIRKKDASNDDYNTMFIVNMVMSVLLYTILFVCAPLIADFFNREELVNLTRVTTLSMIIGALSIVQNTRLTKRIDFKSQTKITFTASIISGIVGISMAFLGFGVWALVVQQLVSSTLRAVLLCMVNKWMPRLKFSKESFHELFGFGWKLMAGSILNTVWNELNQVVVGKFYSPATLGQYTRAKHFSQIFSKNLTGVIQRVTYPVLANIQDERERMISAYRRIIKVTMFIASISMFFLGAISEPFLYCLIGPKWHDASVYLPLICFVGSTYPLHAINLNMLQVQGRSDLFLRLEIIKKTIGIAPLSVCIFYGIMPMLYTTVITDIIAFFLNSHYSGRLIGYSSWMQIKDIVPSYGAAAMIALSIYFLKYVPLSYWVVLPMQLISGIVLFFIVCHRMEEFRELKVMAMPVLKKMKL